MKINNGITWTILESETIIVNSHNDEGVRLNSSGTELWKYIVMGKDKESIIEELISLHNQVYERDIREDVNKFFSFLIHKGIGIE